MRGRWEAERCEGRGRAGDMSTKMMERNWSMTVGFLGLRGIAGAEMARLGARMVVRRLRVRETCRDGSAGDSWAADAIG